MINNKPNIEHNEILILRNESAGIVLQSFSIYYMESTP